MEITSTPAPTKPRRHKKRWTEEEDQDLAWGWAQVNIRRLAKKFDRTENAIALRAGYLHLPNASQGYRSLKSVSAELGYDLTTIKSLAKRIGLFLRFKTRTIPNRSKWDGRSRHYAITDDQFEILRTELDRLNWPIYPNKQNTKGIWEMGNKPGSCRRCGSTKRPHHTRGLCSRCQKRCRKDGTLFNYERILRKSS